MWSDPLPGGGTRVVVLHPAARGPAPGCPPGERRRRRRRRLSWPFRQAGPRGRILSPEVDPGPTPRAPRDPRTRHRQLCAASGAQRHPRMAPPSDRSTRRMSASPRSACPRWSPGLDGATRRRRRVCTRASRPRPDPLAGTVDDPRARAGRHVAGRHAGRRSERPLLPGGDGPTAVAPVTDRARCTVTDQRIFVDHAPAFDRRRQSFPGRLRGAARPAPAGGPGPDPLVLLRCRARLRARPQGGHPRLGPLRDRRRPRRRHRGRAARSPTCCATCVSEQDSAPGLRPGRSTSRLARAAIDEGRPNDRRRAAPTPDVHLDLVADGDRVGRPQVRQRRSPSASSGENVPLVTSPITRSPTNTG